MDDNRVKPVSPSLARLKYDSPRKKNSENKKKRKRNNSQESTAKNGKVIDDFA